MVYSGNRCEDLHDYTWNPTTTPQSYFAAPLINRLSIVNFFLQQFGSRYPLTPFLARHPLYASVSFVGGDSCRCCSLVSLLHLLLEIYPNSAVSQPAVRYFSRQRYSTGHLRALLARHRFLRNLRLVVVRRRLYVLSLEIISSSAVYQTSGRRCACSCCNNYQRASASLLFLLRLCGCAGGAGSSCRISERDPASLGARHVPAFPLAAAVAVVF